MSAGDGGRPPPVLAPDQRSRLAAFQERHPAVEFGRGPHGRRDASVPLPDGSEGYYSPRSLPDLLDVLEADLDVPQHSPP